MNSLSSTAPSFVEMAHRIVWCIGATTDLRGHPSTRVLHPIWEWDGTELTGWIATSPLSPKAGHLERTPSVSLTYWAPNHDTCTADCVAAWETTPETIESGWRRFEHGPEPVGYDPSIVPGWDSPSAPGFGVLRLVPQRLRVMPGSVMLRGQGEVLTWRR